MDHQIPSKDSNSADKELIKAFEAAGVIKFLQYLQSGRRIMWTNFLAGISRGLGVTVGMTLVLGILVWILTQLVSLPWVGEYFQRIERHIQDFTEQTNYKDDFEEVRRLLREINDNLKR